MTNRTVFIITDRENFDCYRAIPLWEQRVEFHPLDCSVHAIRQGAPDLLLIDCGFDESRGLCLLHEIKAASPDIMVIFITDTRSEDAAIHAFRQGARDYFRKPVDLFNLRDVIEKLLKIKGRANEKRSHLGISDKKESGASAVTLPGDTPANLLRVIHYIEKNLSTQLTIDHLAEQAWISRYHFCRKFKRHTGMSPMNFVTMMRIERAKVLLGRSIPISSVALKAGFNDLGNFIRCFKKVTGHTPSAYRRIDTTS